MTPGFSARPKVRVNRTPRFGIFSPPFPTASHLLTGTRRFALLDLSTTFIFHLPVHPLKFSPKTPARHFQDSLHKTSYFSGLHSFGHEWRLHKLQPQRILKNKYIYSGQVGEFQPYIFPKHTMLTDLPYNVLDTIILFSDNEVRLSLAQLNSYFRHSVYRSLYRNIMIVDSKTSWQIDQSQVKWTLIPADRLQQFASCINVFNFGYVERIVLNTHTNEYDQPLLQLYQKLSALWNYSGHTVDVANYDVLSLRTVGPLTKYLALSSVQFIDIEDEDRCEVSRKDHKVSNLKSWFVFDTTEFLALPVNPELQQLRIYVERNSYNGTSRQENLLCESFAPGMQNLQNLTQLYMHSPLSYLRFTEMLDTMQAPQLSLQRLSLTSSHRPRNNAILDFQYVNKYFDLNNLQELELKLSCIHQHDCSDSCMVKFFEDWRKHNNSHQEQTNLKKLSIVHHKSLAETTQFKRIVEDYVFSPLFKSVEEIYLNLADSVRSSSISMDLIKIFDNLASVPLLSKLHISSFMNEWVSRLPQLLNKRNVSHLDVLVNQCDCATCNVARSNFIKLARLDKSNNYNHKARLADVDSAPSVGTRVDFSEVTNIKYLQYVAGQLKKQENCMERNLHSVGSMLNMDDMPVEQNEEMMPFSTLFAHSCLEEFFKLTKERAPQLCLLNLGGIGVGSH